MLDLLAPRGIVVALYALFISLTAVALVLARWVRRRPSLALSPSLLSPLGSLYSLTTAFLLSNVIFQYTNLRTAITQEVVTLNKLAAVMAVLPAEQRIEGRRLLYDYGESTALDEALTMRKGERSERTQDAMDHLRDFLASPDAALTEPSDKNHTPESANYLRKASDLGFDLIDARERRLSLVRQTLPPQLWRSIALMYFALALPAFLVHSDRTSLTWVTVILLLSAPVPAVLLALYSNPFASGLINMTATLDAVLERSL
jgi:Protein of unknown function (DUF4239)